MKLNITVLDGDGVGPEVTAQAVKALKAIAVEFDHRFIFKHAAVGAAASDQFDDPLPQQTLDLCRNANAILSSAIDHYKYENDPNAKVLQELGLLKLRKKLGLYANIRTVKAYEALLDKSPLKRDVIAGTDIMIFSELTGDLLNGEKHLSDDGNYTSDLCVYSREEIERIAHLAFKAAQGRCQKLTLVDSANVLETSRLWQRVVKNMALQYPDVKLDFLCVDNAAMQLILNPRQFDVILTDNLFGDIIYKVASAVVGSKELLGSVSMSDRHAMFIPIHGSYPKAAGKNVANPLASIVSAAMLLEHFELYSEAEMIKTAVNRSLELGITTPDLNDTYNNITTSKVGDFIADFIAHPYDTNANFNNIHMGQSTII